MGIRMIPEQFDQDRKQDPKRAAEARVFDALLNLDHDGYGIYEFCYRRGGREVDVALWLDDLARFAVQVKGGQYEMDETGQWYLVRPDGSRDKVGSPLSATADACMEMRNAVREATRFKTFVVGVLISRTCSATRAWSGPPSTTSTCTSSGDWTACPRTSGG